MSRPAKPNTAAAASSPPVKNKQKLIIIILVIVLLIGGGVAAFLLMKPAPPAKSGDTEVEEAHSSAPPIYVPLGTFTANLIHEEGDRYLQVAIDLKVTKPELAEKIKATSPEILHHVNMLLQSKRPSELATFDGKQKLAKQIKEQVEYVLGLRKIASIITDTDATPNKEEHSAQTETHASKSGIADVLFTSFIIQ